MADNPGNAVTCGGQDLVNEERQGLDRQEEFARLVLCRQTRMLRTIWRVVHDPNLAEDALQDALTTLWRKLPALARHPNPEAFVLRVALNAAWDQLRAQARRSRRDVPLDDPDASSSLRAWQIVHDRAASEEVRRAIGRLPKRQATALLLRVVHDESYETIARTLRCSEATARVHVTRAREKLRRWLSHLRDAVHEERSS